MTVILVDDYGHILVKDCMPDDIIKIDEEFFPCGQCGNAVLISDAVIVDGEQICSSCAKCGTHKKE